MHIDVNNLSISYGERLIVDRISFSLAPGESLSIVGESGSGKTSIIRAIMGCLVGDGRVSGGTISLDGQILDYKERGLYVQGQQSMTMIFQDSGNMLNPIRTIGSQFVDYIRHHRPHLSKKEANAMACHLLNRVHLQDGQGILNGYAFELSGGMRQRIGIAMALALEPSILLADEPTSALDVTTQAQILSELSHMQKQNKMSMILVTHNLGVASCMSDKILVLQGGNIVEYGATDQVLSRPQSDYTRSLLASVPKIGREAYYVKP